MTWIEARLNQGSEPSELYDSLSRRPTEFHHFWDEPWWPGAYVIRLRGITRAQAERCPAVHHTVRWDSAPDEEAYGDDWRAARQLFELGSTLSLAEDRRAKFVHCFLNAHGMSRWAEVRWALHYAWRSALLPLRWRLYLRRRWERAQ